MKQRFSPNGVGLSSEINDFPSYPGTALQEQPAALPNGFQTSSLVMMLWLYMVLFVSSKQESESLWQNIIGMDGSIHSILLFAWFFPLTHPIHCQFIPLKVGQGKKCWKKKQLHHFLNPGKSENCFTNCRLILLGTVPYTVSSLQYPRDLQESLSYYHHLVSSRMGIFLALLRWT